MGTTPTRGRGHTQCMGRERHRRCGQGRDVGGVQQQCCRVLSTSCQWHCLHAPLTSSLQMALEMSSTHVPVNGSSPYTKQYRHTPSAHTSEAIGSSSLELVIASGDWNAGVQLTLVLVELSPIMRALPKSPILSCPAAVTSRFSGFRSPCATLL